ncbi:ROK family transcriptional regulator [Nonomuraea sp. SBT364]|uniref:ROK family transcriptional regulator n=1 Tax=Nonomuraea sp. SBT364 TaxID=1580530 RepID=UPI00066D94CF|nr:ROK family transcriptional regulator [Nonomuraea sp. SBT364]
MPDIASPHTARLINDRMAYDLLLAHGPMSRAELQQRTGLSRATVGELVDRMVESGLISQAGQSQTRRRGPNALLYGVVADRAHVAGVEVRPDRVLVSVNDVTGRQIGGAVLPLDPRAEPDRLVHDAIAAALAGTEGIRLAGVVIGTQGVVDPVSGDVAYIQALPTWHANLLPGLRDRLGVPVLVENEVNLVGLAEHRLGAARGRDTFALLSLGEGLGMAVILDGRLHRGRSGGAGEIAYAPTGLGGGTLQDLVGGGAVRELADRHGLPAGDVAAALRQVTPGFLDELADRVAVAALGACAVLDPGFVVLAGEIGRAAGAPLAARVEERLQRGTPLPAQVAAGTVEGDPVLRGAVVIALERLHRQTFGRSSGS